MAEHNSKIPSTNQCTLPIIRFNGWADLASVCETAFEIDFNIHISRNTYIITYTALNSSYSELPNEMVTLIWSEIFSPHACIDTGLVEACTENYNTSMRWNKNRMKSWIYKYFAKLFVTNSLSVDSIKAHERNWNLTPTHM